MIKKDSKNQIRLESLFYDLLSDNQKNNIIELKEDNNKNNKIETENEKLNNNILRKIDTEIKFINNLIKSNENKLLLYRNNYENNDIENNINLENTKNSNKRNNMNTINNINNINIINNNDNKTPNILLENKNICISLEPNFLDLKNIFNLNFNEDNIINTNNNKNVNQNISKNSLKQQNEKKEVIPDFIKEQNNNNSIDDDYINIFSYETNKNELFLPNKNMDYNLRKESFISDYFLLENINSFNCEKDNIFG